MTINQYYFCVYIFLLFVIDFLCNVHTLARMHAGFTGPSVVAAPTALEYPLLQVVPFDCAIDPTPVKYATSSVEHNLVPLARTTVESAPLAPLACGLTSPDPAGLAPVVLSAGTYISSGLASVGHVQSYNGPTGPVSAVYTDPEQPLQP